MNGKADENGNHLDGERSGADHQLLRAGARRSTNQMERGMAKLQAENLGSVKSKLEHVLFGDCKRIAVE